MLLCGCDVEFPRSRRDARSSTPITSSTATTVAVSVDGRRPTSDLVPLPGDSASASDTVQMPHTLVTTVGFSVCIINCVCYNKLS